MAGHSGWLLGGARELWVVTKVFVGCSGWLLGGARVLWLDARVFVGYV